MIKEFILRWLQRPTPPGAHPVIPVYLDLKRLGLSPESFAIEYIGAVLYWFLEKGEGRADDYTRLPALLRAASTLGNTRVLDAVLELDADLRQQPILQRRLLELAFNFPETLARELGGRFLICIDEFQDLSLLSNFPQVGDEAFGRTAPACVLGSLLRHLAGCRRDPSAANLSPPRRQCAKKTS